MPAHTRRNSKPSRHSAESMLAAVRRALGKFSKVGVANGQHFQDFYNAVRVAAFPQHK